MQNVHISWTVKQWQRIEPFIIDCKFIYNRIQIKRRESFSLSPVSLFRKEHPRNDRGEKLSNITCKFISY